MDGNPIPTFVDEMTTYRSQFSEAIHRREQEKFRKEIGKLRREVGLDQEKPKSMLSKGVSAVFDVFAFLIELTLKLMEIGFFLGIGWYLRKMKEDGSLRKIYSTEMEGDGKKLTKFAKVVANVLITIANNALNDISKAINA